MSLHAELGLSTLRQIGELHAPGRVAERTVATTRPMHTRTDVYTSRRIEPASGVEREVLLDTWRQFFASDTLFTPVHFAIFTDNMIRLIGGRVEGSYREAHLITTPSSEHDIDAIHIQWSPSNTTQTIPGGNASIELIGNSDEGYSIAERFEYGENVRGGDDVYLTPTRVREAILPEKFRSPMTGNYIESTHVRLPIGTVDPVSFRSEGRAIAEKVFNIVGITPLPG